MISLSNYIKNGLSIIDCHVHLFGRRGVLNYPKPINSMVVMVENSIGIDETLEPYYANLKKYPQYLLGVGRDVDETKTILDKYPCSGIGEIKAYKCYKNSKGEYHEHYNPEFLEEFADSDIPVFVHWDLNGKHDDELYNIIKSHPGTKFVLCHCGMNEVDDPSVAFKTVVSFQNQLTNLWLSISWTSLDYFQDHMTQLSFIPIPDHTIVGTDFSGDMELMGVDFNDRYDKFRRMYNRFDVPTSIKNLFCK